MGLGPGRSGLRIGPGAVSKALDVLLEASAPLKRDVLRACASAVGSDGQITVEEGELLRAIADSLDSPMPPILTPQGEFGLRRSDL